VSVAAIEAEYTAHPAFEIAIVARPAPPSALASGLHDRADHLPIDYQLKSWATLRIGYRSLNFDCTAAGGGLGFNVHMKAPILVAAFRF
jgi:hypothetical protein